MKRVHRARSLADVSHFKNLLEQAGIGSFVKHAALSGALGDLPVFDVEPELWVYRDTDERRAAAIIREALTGAPPTSHAWRCSRCGEHNEPQFAACWRCGTPDGE